MKRNTMAALFAAMMWLMLALPAGACAMEMSAEGMEDWLARFCAALPQVMMLGDPQQTTDPARPGEYLLEYEFGTVTAKAANGVEPEDICQIDVRTAQVTDCLGIRVGVPLDELLDGQSIGKSSTQLAVLHTLEAGLGFSWAYLDEDTVYGVEHVAYGGEGASMKEYTLTYVIGDTQTVDAIRIRIAKTTQAEALQAMRTAEEIIARQKGEVYAVRNEAPVLDASSLQMMGLPVLGIQAADLVGMLGEPVEIQTLSGNRGRLLLYEGAAIELMLDEQTGEEIVCGVSASASDVFGPRGLAVGMAVQEAAARFACDEDVYSVGGVLYARGEAMGLAPYAELVRGHIQTEAMLRYVTADESGRMAVLEISIQDALVRNWHFYTQREAQHGGY